MLGDAHIHLFERGFSGSRDADEDAADYEALRAAHSIGPAVVVGYEGGPAFAGNNEYILGLARDRAWMRPLAFVGGAPLPGPAGIRQLLDRGFSGISLYLDGITSDLVGWCTKVAPALAGAVVSINADLSSLEHHGQAIGMLAGSSVLASHLANPRDAVGLGVRAQRDALAPLLALARFDHVAVKVSGLYDSDPGFPHERMRPVIEWAAGEFGPRRLLWGSDYPVVLDYLDPANAMAIPPWFAEVFAPDELTGVLGGNLGRLLGPVSA